MKLKTKNIHGTVGITGGASSGKTTLALQMAADIRCHVVMLKNRDCDKFGVFFNDEPKVAQLFSRDGVQVTTYIY